MSRCVVCGAEGHGAERHGFPDDWSEQDQSELNRQAELYANLSEGDRRFVVTQWDHQNGLECWQERLRKKQTARGVADKFPNRITRAQWVAVGVFTVFVLAMLIDASDFFRDVGIDGAVHYWVDRWTHPFTPGLETMRLRGFWEGVSTSFLGMLLLSVAFWLWRHWSD